MSKMFLIKTNTNGLYSTYINKQVIFCFPNIKIANNIKNIMINNHRKHNKWINDYECDYELDAFSHQINLQMGHKSKKEILSINSFDFNNPKDCEEIEKVYKMSNVKFFVVGDYTHFQSNDTMSIRGLFINHDIDQENNILINSLYNSFNDEITEN
jgi:hypothetical protein